MTESKELFCIICNHQEFSHKTDGTLVKHKSRMKDNKPATGLLCSKCGHVLSKKTQDVPWENPVSVFEKVKQKTMNGYTRRS